MDQIEEDVAVLQARSRSSSGADSAGIVSASLFAAQAYWLSMNSRAALSMASFNSGGGLTLGVVQDEQTPETQIVDSPQRIT